MTDREFWTQRWEKNEIGFHQSDVNPFLSRYAPQLFSAEDRVLVPLCGKSLDLLFLASRVRNVIGVELSRMAVDAFFSENQLPVEEPFPGRLVSRNIELICSDYFEVNAENIGLVDGVYDRASLVALDEPTRRRYASHTSTLVKPGGRILLITFAFDEKNRTGPPFHVSPAEVETLYADFFRIELLETKRSSDARFGGFQEHCIRLVRRPEREHK